MITYSDVGVVQSHTGESAPSPNDKVPQKTVCSLRKESITIINVENSFVMQQIGATKIVAILRGLSEEKVIRVVKALVAGGVNVVELTMDTPGASRMIGRLQEEAIDGLCVGAGTVLNPAMVREACAAGAQFIITPMLDRSTVDEAVRLDRPIIPGVMTPSEIFAAGQAGASAVKLFPASILGPRYVREVSTPLPNPPMIPTGGIHPENAASYLEAGAFALGVGSWLLPSEAIHVGNFEMVKARAQSLVHTVTGTAGE